jgi:uncharacterized protein (DUF2141 family)
MGIIRSNAQTTDSWIRINQLRYLQGSIKAAVYLSTAKHGNNADFRIKDIETDKIVFEGKGIAANAGRWGMKKAFRRLQCCPFCTRCF